MLSQADSKTMCSFLHHGHGSLTLVLQSFRRHFLYLQVRAACCSNIMHSAKMSRSRSLILISPPRRCRARTSYFDSIGRDALDHVHGAEKLDIFPVMVNQLKESAAALLPTGRNGANVERSSSPGDRVVLRRISGGIAW